MIVLLPVHTEIVETGEITDDGLPVRAEVSSFGEVFHRPQVEGDWTHLLPECAPPVVSEFGMFVGRKGMLVTRRFAKKHAEPHWECFGLPNPEAEPLKKTVRVRRNRWGQELSVTVDGQPARIRYQTDMEAKKVDKDA